MKREGLASISDEDLQGLLRIVDLLLPAINAYLDETGNAERAAPYGDIAQAAVKVRIELDRRRN